ncbi:hypothetical protein Ami3637_14225 [Aminipila terrae]|uniref:Uncharacterized protein n=1 Tax=Aminipila terrae TaxID=2697030 RepID=A0A6P1MJB9_9FIRM|nr:hypothetical protein Ami3637_14225 [Aminipila terrae]
MDQLCEHYCKRKSLGLYLAVEDVSDSFITRNYGENQGELYKPESEQLNNLGKGQKGMIPPQELSPKGPEGIKDLLVD